VISALWKVSSALGRPTWAQSGHWEQQSCGIHGLCVRQGAPDLHNCAAGGPRDLGEALGMAVVTTEESYTSQTSFVRGDKLEAYAEKKQDGSTPSPRPADGPALIGGPQLAPPQKPECPLAVGASRRQRRLQHHPQDLSRLRLPYWPDVEVHPLPPQPQIGRPAPRSG